MNDRTVVGCNPEFLRGLEPLQSFLLDNPDISDEDLMATVMGAIEEADAETVFWEIVGDHLG